MPYRTAEAAEKPKVRSCQWWRAKENGKEPHQMLEGLLDTIQKDQQSRYESYKEWARSLDQDMSSVDGSVSFKKLWGTELSINEALNTLETLHAQIFKNKIIPAPVPTEGDYEEHFQALAFGRWLEGLFDDSKVHEEHVPQFGWDCLAYGTGAIKAYGKIERRKGGKRAKICLEAVSPRFLFVDRIEARCGRPRSLHQKMHMDRWVVLDRWGKKSNEAYTSIVDAKPYDDVHFDISDTADGDQITIWESWHLPSYHGADDGRHTIWMKGCTLVDEKWEHDRFPFTFMRFGRRLGGFWGQSACMRILPSQKAFARLTRQIDDAMEVMAVPRIVVRSGANIKKSHIDDTPYTILESERGKDDIHEWNAQPVNPAMFQERDSFPARMRESIGVTGFAAQQALPEQIRDGAAAYMDRAVEEADARHAMLHREYESAMVDLGDLSLMVAEELDSKNYDIVVRAPGEEMRTTVEMLEFSKVKIAREHLKLRVLPISQLPRTFANRLKDLTILRDRGDIPQKTFLRLLEIPDVEAEIDNLVSDEDVIRRNHSFMLRTGKYTSPLPYDNLELIIKLTARKIHQARTREVDEDKIALLVQYIDDAVKLKNGIGTPQEVPGLAPPAGMLPPGPGGPMAPPGAPIQEPGLSPAEMGGAPPAMQPPLTEPPLPAAA